MLDRTLLRHGAMRRVLPMLAAVALGPLLVPGHGLAQTTTGAITVRFVSIDGDAVTATPRPVGLDECTEPSAMLEFDVKNIPSDKTTLDIYVGTECNLNSRNTEDASCDFVVSKEISGRTDFKVEVDAAKTPCATGMPTLWFLAVDTSMGGDEVGTGYGSLEVRFDTTPPAAPTNVEGGAGEREIPVSWKTSEAENEKFIVYIDSQATRGGDDSDGGVSGDGECSSSRLVAGAAADDIPAGVPTKVKAERTATNLDLSPDDIDGDFAAVAVLAVDEAGNKGVLSELACVEVVDTEGFWENYESNGGTATEGCEIRAHAGRTGGSVVGALPVWLALIALARTRRRRA